MDKYGSIPLVLVAGWHLSDVSHEPNQEFGLHYHDVEERLEVLEGRISFFAANGQEYRVFRYEALHIPRGEVHRASVGPEGVKYRMWVPLHVETFRREIERDHALLIRDNLALPAVENEWDQNKGAFPKAEDAPEFLKNFVSDDLVFRTAAGDILDKKDYLERKPGDVRSASNSVFILDRNPNSILISTVVHTKPAAGNQSRSFSNLRLFLREGDLWRCRVWMNYLEPGITMPGSHSRAAKYMCLPETLNTVGNNYELPDLPDDGPSWLAGSRVLVISADGPELPEVDVPIQYLRARGAEVKLAGQDWIFEYRTPPGYIVLAQWLADNVCIKADLRLSEVRAADYDAVFVPGGAWNPDMLRTDGKALEIIRDARTHGLLMVSLCHGPQVLISANVDAPDGKVLFPAGTRITGVGSIRVDLKNAGFEVVDQATVYDEKSQLLTARDPNDLGPLCIEMGNLLRRRVERRT